MLVGYARLSEYEQPADLDAQKRALVAAGCVKVFTGTSVCKGPQAAREAAIAFVREGDCLVIARPDRLARTPTELMRLSDGLTKRGVGLVVLSGFGPKLDTRDHSCAPLLAALRGIVEWDRAGKRELQRVGIRRGQAAGKFRGKVSKLPVGAVRALAADGLGPTAISKVLKISLTSVKRALPPGYRVTPKPKRVPRQRLDARTIQAMLAAGLGPTAIAKTLGCERRSIYRLGYGT